MNCPACSTPLHTARVDNVEIEVCTEGCHGIFLDRHELNDSDDKAEPLGAAILSLFDGPPKVSPDTTKRYRCPHCEMWMMRHKFRPNIEVTVDTCPKCAGVWLDGGELERIRGVSGDEAERRASTEKFVRMAFGRAVPTIKS